MAHRSWPDAWARLRTEAAATPHRARSASRSDRTARRRISTIASAAGLERVKGLLRSYEDGEAQQAARQGRSEISYQFLWDALGLAR